MSISLLHLGADSLAELKAIAEAGLEAQAKHSVLSRNDLAIFIETDERGKVVSITHSLLPLEEEGTTK